MIQKIFINRAALILVFLLAGSNVFAQQRKVMVFSKTAQYRHKEAIPAGKKAIIQLGKENHFAVDITENAEKFTPENLKQYDAIIFLCTTGNVLNTQQQRAFRQYIESGGGYVGNHSATDTEYGWPWYGKLVGAYFEEHPKVQPAILDVINHNFPGTKDLPDRWKRTDEWYDFKWMEDSLNVLIKIDKSSYTGSTMGKYHPMCWYHNYDGGRAFYMEFGHTAESYTDPLFLNLLLGAIQYAMGTKPAGKIATY